MRRRPPRPTRTYPLFPYTPLFRSRLSLSRARPGSGPAPAFQAAFRRSRCLARLRLPVEQLLFHLASTGRGGYQGYNDQPVRRFRAMNEEIFNMELRKFLKKVGVTSQREIETAVRNALESGTQLGRAWCRDRVCHNV